MKHKFIIILFLFLPRIFNEPVTHKENIVYDSLLSGELSQHVEELLKINNIKNVSVHIVKQTILLDKVKAYVIGENHQYMIYIQESLSKYEKIVTLSHEVVHIEQMESGALVPNKEYFIWENRKYSFDTPRELREWEAEAELIGIVNARKYIRNMKFKTI